MRSLNYKRGSKQCCTFHLLLSFPWCTHAERKKETKEAMQKVHLSGENERANNKQIRSKIASASSQVDGTHERAVIKIIKVKGGKKRR
jgi:hypothetical protein